MERIGHSRSRSRERREIGESLSLPCPVFRKITIIPLFTDYIMREGLVIA